MFEVMDLYVTDGVYCNFSGRQTEDMQVPCLARVENGKLYVELADGRRIRTSNINRICGYVDRLLIQTGSGSFYSLFYTY